MKTTIAAGMLVMLTLAGNAVADTATCPPIQSIKQTLITPGVADDGFSYTSPGPTGTGLTWQGDNQMADESLLAASTFHDAAYKPSTEAVICSYEGKGDAGVRVVLKPVKNWSAAPGTAWSGQSCTASDISKCSFSYTR